MSAGTYVCLKNCNFKTEIEQFPSFLASQFDKKISSLIKNSCIEIKQKKKRKKENLVAFQV